MKFIFLYLISLTIIFSESINQRILTKLIHIDKEYPIGLSMEILTTNDKNLNWNEVKSLKEFEESRILVPNYGFTRSVYWTRFHIKNETDNKEWYIHISYPLLDKIEFYFHNSKKEWEKLTTGDTYSFAQRPIRERSFIFPIKLEKNKNYTFYFRFESQGTVQFPITIYSPTEFIKLKEKENLSLGAYYGILAVLIVYNLILFFMLRERGYLYYLLYIFFFGASQSVLNGLAFQYLWPDSPNWANKSLPFLGGFSLFWGLQFTRSFLNTTKNTPFFDKIILVLMGFMLLLMLSSFIFSYYFNIYLLAALVISFAIIVFLVAILCWDRGYRPARYFLIAWVVFLFGIGIYSFKGFGILPTNIFTEYGLQIGSALEMSLLSLGLAYKIKLTNNEKSKAEKLATSFKEQLQEAKLISSRLEIELLKNNIHPHFLLNSINSTIIWLDEDPLNAKKLLAALSDEFRTILKLSNKKLIPISEEIKICKRYLEIMSLRKDVKFTLKVNHIDGNELFPPIVLHTLVENGLTHGYRSKKTGEFILTKKNEGKKIKYILFNDGLPTSDTDTSGTGIKYIRSRLSEAFGSKWDFQSKAVLDGWESIITIHS